MLNLDAERFDTQRDGLCPALRWKGQFIEAEPDSTGAAVQRWHLLVYAHANLYWTGWPAGGAWQLCLEVQSVSRHREVCLVKDYRMYSRIFSATSGYCAISGSASAFS